MQLFFYLSATFDTVNHDLLLSKLFAEFGFTDVALEWFLTYLIIRSYFIKVARYASHKVDVTSGVPQTFILGPVLLKKLKVDWWYRTGELR